MPSPTTNPPRAAHPLRPEIDPNTEGGKSPKTKAGEHNKKSTSCRGDLD